MTLRSATSDWKWCLKRSFRHKEQTTFRSSAAVAAWICLLLVTAVFVSVSYGCAERVWASEDGVQSVGGNNDTQGGDVPSGGSESLETALRRTGSTTTGTNEAINSADALEGAESGLKNTTESDNTAVTPDSSAASRDTESTVSESVQDSGKVDHPHVHGIRNFSIIEGMVPDPMAGISWDETIGTVLCNLGDVDWGKLGTWELTYTIADMDQNISFETIEVTVYENLEYYLYGMEGEKKITINSSFDPMEGITYDKKIVSVTADTSALDLSKAGEYPVSYELKAQDGRTQTAVRRVRVAAGGADGWDNSDNAGNYSTVIDLGLWRLTAYMDTPEDQGPYVGQTASGAPLIPGRTVAVSAATCARLGLYFGDKLLIDGHVYTLEDHGGSAMNNQDWADIFVDNPIDEFSERFNHFTEVYLLR